MESNRNEAPGTTNMGDIVNLNLFRKKKERLEREEKSAANRARSGVDKKTKRGIVSKRQQTKKNLDGKRLEKGDD